jgi:hypothetical protein
VAYPCHTSPPHPDLPPPGGKARKTCTKIYVPVLRPHTGEQIGTNYCFRWEHPLSAAVRQRNAQGSHEACCRIPPEKPMTQMITTGSDHLPVAARQIPVASPAASAPTNRQTGLSSLDNTSHQPCPPAGRALVSSHAWLTDCRRRHGRTAPHEEPQEQSPSAQRNPHSRSFRLLGRPSLADESTPHSWRQSPWVLVRGVGKELCHFSDSLFALSLNGGLGKKRTFRQQQHSQQKQYSRCNTEGHRLRQCWLSSLSIRNRTAKVTLDRVGFPSKRLNISIH